jgi:uncharacterized protein (TIGR03118 family)
MNTKSSLLTAALAAAVVASVGTPALASDPFSGPFEFTQTNLVADTQGIAVTTDPLLVDPWGLAFVPGGAFWVNDKGTGVATLYTGTGTKNPNVFTVPNPVSSTAASNPTGLVWNPSSGFPVPGTKLPSVFIFATLQGSIAAWAANLPVNPTDAVTAVDNSKAGAVYTGLEFGVNDQGTFIYAANVHSGQIDVFDTNFQPANAKLPGQFMDSKIPAGFAPFGIHAVEGNLVVTYAMQNAAKTFITPAAGAGFVDIFDTNGNLLQRVGRRGALNAPWGVALAPAGFAGASSELLVGNFGDGHIQAFGSKIAGTQYLLDKHGQPIVLPGLWSLHFGGGAVSDPRTLFFTEGVDQGQHGLFGALNALHPALPTP